MVKRVYVMEVERYLLKKGKIFGKPLENYGVLMQCGVFQVNVHLHIEWQEEIIGDPCVSQVYP